MGQSASPFFPLAFAFCVPEASAVRSSPRLRPSLPPSLPFFNSLNFLSAREPVSFYLLTIPPFSMEAFRACLTEASRACPLLLLPSFLSPRTF